MPKTVAIVGGSSGLGLHIVEAIHNARLGGAWRVIVFSRASKQLPGLPSVPVIAVSYGPEGFDGLVNALRSNDVHTVICSIGALNEGLVKSQLAVLDAAMKSGTVRRFVPSEWAGLRSKFHPYRGQSQFSFFRS
jgi:NAD(P)-dependent dehydrogenase (short-subunit alcohol dehydrogenase family)